MKKYNFILITILIVIGISIFVLTADMLETTNNALGAGIWPRILAILLIPIILGLIIQTFSLKSAWAEILIDFKSGGVHRVFQFLGLFIIYGVALNFLGFILSNLFFVPCVMKILGEKSNKTIIITSLSITIFIFIVFVKLLNVVFPQPFFM